MHHDSISEFLEGFSFSLSPLTASSWVRACIFRPVWVQQALLWILRSVISRNFGEMKSTCNTSLFELFYCLCQGVKFSRMFPRLFMVCIFPVLSFATPPFSLSSVSTDGQLKLYHFQEKDVGNSSILNVYIPRTFRIKCLLTSPASLEAMQVYLPESSVSAWMSWRTIPWVLTVRWASSPTGWPSLSHDIRGVGVPSVRHVMEVELPLTTVMSSVPMALSRFGGTTHKRKQAHFIYLLWDQFRFKSWRVQLVL